MENMLVDTTNYVRFIDCTRDAVKRKKELQDRLPKEAKRNKLRLN